MQLKLSRETEESIQRHLATGQFASPEDVVRAAVAQLDEYAEAVHDLRASFATNYIEANPNQLWELMELLGHVSPSSTCLYIRSRGKTRLLSMKQARGPRPGRTGFSAMVYNR